MLAYFTQFVSISNINNLNNCVFTVNACYLKNISILNLDTFVKLSARNNNSYCPTHKAKKNGRHFQNNRSNFLSMIIYSTTVILLFCCILTHKRCHLILYKAWFSRFLLKCNKHRCIISYDCQTKLIVCTVRRLFHFKL